MSILGTLNAGRTGLSASQAGINVVSNNIANASNPNYTRQTVEFGSLTPSMIRRGLFMGNGVGVNSIRRAIDESLEQRLRAATSTREGSAAFDNWMGRVESVFNELSDQDISSAMSQFFNGWGELATKPQDLSQRQVVLQHGRTLASRFQSVRGDLEALRNDSAERLRTVADEANRIASDIASLNAQIAVSEGGAGGNNGLRDNRDGLARRLAELIDINTTVDSRGIMNVFVGSEPLVLGTESKGVGVQIETVNGEAVSTVTFAATGQPMPLAAGQLAALSRTYGSIGDTIDEIDDLAGRLIFELNKIHTSGRGLQGFAGVSATNSVADSAAALNTNASGLAFKPVNGSFVVHVRDKTTGAETSTMVRIDLDGIGADTSLDDLAAQLNGISGISASVNGGRLSVNAASSSLELGFSQDSSGTLAALGIGGFFQGTNAASINVASAVNNNPGLLATSGNGQPNDNTTALAIADLKTRSLSSLGGRSLAQTYDATVTRVAGGAATARTDADAASAVYETLQGQREAVSGVSLDEEAIKLIQFQRAYQGSARVVQAADEMLQTLINLL
jgi:flagellar hook-associated protein 1 FlgK